MVLDVHVAGSSTTASGQAIMPALRVLVVKQPVRFQLAQRRPARIVQRQRPILACCGAISCDIRGLQVLAAALIAEAPVVTCGHFYLAGKTDRDLSPMLVQAQAVLTPRSIEVLRWAEIGYRLTLDQHAWLSRLSRLTASTARTGVVGDARLAASREARRQRPSDRSRRERLHVAQLGLARRARLAALPCPIRGRCGTVWQHCGSGPRRPSAPCTQTAHDAGRGCER